MTASHNSPVAPTGARRASMADVAARAGVSGQTVSRVVNGSPRVDPVTRDRVERAMTELAYRPHRAARALRTGRAGTIGVVAATLASVGNSRMLQAVTEAAAVRGIAITVALAPVGEGLVDVMRRLDEIGVDGVIILNEATSAVWSSDVASDAPMVFVDAPRTAAAGRPRGAVVQTDHYRGAVIAVEHLWSLGHRRIMHLAGPIGSFAAAERERGWREAITRAGGTAAEPVRGDWSAASGFAAGAGIVERNPTAVFVANDQMALGLLRDLDERGVRVPDQLSLVGFDDIEDAASFSPPLTTLRQDFASLGDRAVALLLDGPGTDDQVTSAVDIELVPATLVVRDSSAAWSCDSQAALRRASQPVRTISSTE